jgi:hypothetical protein
MRPLIKPEAALFAFRASALAIAAALVGTVLLPVLSVGAHIVS